MASSLENYSPLVVQKYREARNSGWAEGLSGESDSMPADYVPRTTVAFRHENLWRIAETFISETAQRNHTEVINIVAAGGSAAEVFSLAVLCQRAQLLGKLNPHICCTFSVLNIDAREVAWVNAGVLPDQQLCRANSPIRTSPALFTSADPNLLGHPQLPGTKFAADQLLTFDWSPVSKLDKYFYDSIAIRLEPSFTSRISGVQVDLTLAQDIPKADVVVINNFLYHLSAQGRHACLSSLAASLNPGGTMTIEDDDYFACDQDFFNWRVEYEDWFRLEFRDQLPQLKERKEGWFAQDRPRQHNYVKLA